MASLLHDTEVQTKNCSYKKKTLKRSFPQQESQRSLKISDLVNSAYAENLDSQSVPNNISALFLINQGLKLSFLLFNNSKS